MSILIPVFIPSPRQIAWAGAHSFNIYVHGSWYPHRENYLVEITLSLLTPYAAFLLPAHFGGSGVLAAIAANGPLLIPAATRLQGIFFWDLLVYLLEGLVFLVTGLQIRTVLDRLDPISLRGPLLSVLPTVAAVIVARFVWVFPAVYLPRWLSPKLARRDPAPPWQQVFFLAFVGIRGVVSLAAALAIPLVTLAGAPFPYRDLIEDRAYVGKTPVLVY